MPERHDLSTLDWTLSGWIPHLWRLARLTEANTALGPEIDRIPAVVPGSVQRALRDAGHIPDWNLAHKAREVEWVENRHWIFEATIPHAWGLSAESVTLLCEGLDYSGWVLLNGVEIGSFRGTHVPHSFDLTGLLELTGNTLAIVFDVPPRWLGQFGYTSTMTDWKPRFNYTWDWQPRLVQAGIWDRISIETNSGPAFGQVRVGADLNLSTSTGILHISGEVHSGVVEVALTGPDGATSRTFNADEFSSGISWTDLKVETWWPNGLGEQPLYAVELTLLDATGTALDRISRRIGFRNVEWRTCEGAPADADPWLCVVNGTPIFLQGVNFPPLLPNFADVTREDYRVRIATYRDLGLNTIRLNGCGFVEREDLYDACDEAGILIWQDSPLSSSGLDNLPPSDEQSILALEQILASAIERRSHHASLLMWSGGNELATHVDGELIPITVEHPLIKRLAAVVQRDDPSRRFIPSSPTGARFSAKPEEFGAGINGNVHGPWKPQGPDLFSWNKYWDGLDAQFAAELGAPGASPRHIIERYFGGEPAMPVSPLNPSWARPLTSWLDDVAFAEAHGRDPRDLDEYIGWSQTRQADALSYAIAARKRNFPRNGGALIWCGHDSFPCGTNTSILDFEGEPKPAALALAEVWMSEPGSPGLD